jgi:hypothetical protein
VGDQAAAQGAIARLDGLEALAERRERRLDRVGDDLDLDARHRAERVVEAHGTVVRALQRAKAVRPIFGDGTGPGGAARAATVTRDAVQRRRSPP